KDDRVAGGGQDGGGGVALRQGHHLVDVPAGVVVPLQRHVEGGWAQDVRAGVAGGSGGLGQPACAQLAGGRGDGVAGVIRAAAAAEGVPGRGGAVDQVELHRSGTAAGAVQARVHAGGGGAAVV